QTRTRDASEGMLASVGSDAALSLFVRQTGLPELFLRDELPLAFDDAVTEFRRQIIGQDDACRAAARLVISFKAGMNDPARPVGVLLFCGPTGVGKTELGRALARYFFGAGEQSDRLIRLDMSEYTGFDAAQRLLGRPDGEPSELIRRVRAQPFCVVLLDEIEKADPDVFDMLMGLFDEGRLTDRYGRTTSFRSAIVILTSNIGSDRQKGVGFGAATGPSLETQVQSFFRPEFYNRLDAVVTFAPLAHDVILAITRKELDELNRREGIARLRVQLIWNDAVVEHLAREGFDPRYGARPLQRTLERRIVAPLARWLLEHPDVRECRVQVDVGDHGGLQFSAG
ncbi:MAG TPA: AAA family ATPase, partial [Planctomycetaceae bacterium]|nr:AAA family ATPase [Planctomycetaceae bacterium]